MIQTQQGLSPQELDNFIKEIQSYETQMEVIEAAAKEEEKRKKERPDWILVLWTGLAGSQYHVDETTPGGRKLMRSLRPGTELMLVREADNAYDRWAIAVYTKKEQMLGYVTRYKNETIARLMDNGYVFHAIVEDKKKVKIDRDSPERAYTEDFDFPFSIWMER